MEKPAAPATPPDIFTLTESIHMEFVRVPAGPFLMGSDGSVDKAARKNEFPLHSVDMAEFYIAKYPVTNAQYAAFLDATSHRVPKHWKTGKLPEGKWDHPVVCVSWYDALAFTEWLSTQTKRPIMLPTEAEWEKACRGTDGRVFPWGDTSQIGLVNCAMSISSTTPVQKYSPQGDSIYGVADMVGNTWEWTASLYRKYPYVAQDGREDWNDKGYRVVRGGSWRSAQDHTRCAYRYKNDADLLSDDLGFRVTTPPVVAQDPKQLTREQGPDRSAVVPASAPRSANAPRLAPEMRADQPTSIARPDTFILAQPIRMEFVRVTAGLFMMGSDKSTDKDPYDDELPQHIVELARDFYIGKHPVTNAQYAPFAKVTGRKAPPSGKDDHPVVNVSWRDAVAFTEWLSQQTGKPFRLPAEPEWEKAARGTDGRIYPWGDGWEPERANTREEGPGRTTPVGLYSPGGDSPYGCADMVGNVWEWTGSLLGPYPYRQDDGRENPQGEGARVVRGGSWLDFRRFARCACRPSGLAPDDFNYNIGFRVVLSLSS